MVMNTITRSLFSPLSLFKSVSGKCTMLFLDEGDQLKEGKRGVVVAGGIELIRVLITANPGRCPATVFQGKRTHSDPSVLH